MDCLHKCRCLLPGNPYVLATKTGTKVLLPWERAGVFLGRTERALGCQESQLLAAMQIDALTVPTCRWHNVLDDDKVVTLSGRIQA